MPARRRRPLQPPAPASPLRPALHRPRLAGTFLRPGRLSKDGELTVWTHAQGVYPLRSCWRASAAGAGSHQRASTPRAPAPTATTAPTTRRSTRRSSRFAAPARRSACSGGARTSSATRRWARPCTSSSPPSSTPPARLVDYTAEIWSGSHTGGRGRCLAETALGFRAAAADGPADRSRRDAVQRRHPQRHAVLRHPGPPGDRARGRRAPVRTSSLRGLGGPVNTYAGECFIDELAEIAGQDPLAFRLAMISDPRAQRSARAASRDVRLGRARTGRDRPGARPGLLPLPRPRRLCRRRGRR